MAQRDREAKNQNNFDKNQKNAQDKRQQGAQNQDNKGKFDNCKQDQCAR
ncbi:hypothetical protein [Ethanoligenens harbinense]|uniref:Tetratricopeptide TPR_2 repeat protein n=1 Tax=Ethanoligenens harbinense (strain DSM 18485 / JCM 12961 / CGMCC 1.5033 / YUAN-3) TaxID=663278 RepID=E6U8U0_ETHHY|nr:hypothetical protein [Ethanoligenens harbinense]ADU27175.1 tetratricopeptide TPR_2 repeat protein [Ethanoligenens harbinense YUAN-3]